MSYRKRHIKNKVYKMRPKKGFYKKPVFLIIFWIILFLFACAYLILFFPDFQVKNIVISGNKKTASEDIRSFAQTGINRKIFEVGRWNIFTKSIFLVNSGDLQNKILEKFLVIEKISVNKSLPNTILLGVSERKPVGIFCASECFLIDQNGVAFELAISSSENFLVIRAAAESGEIFVGKKVAEKNIVSAILQIEKTLEENFKINLSQALISSPSRIDAKTGEDWQIYFNPNFDINAQTAKLSALLESDVFQDGREGLLYIDLRFEGKAYYK